MKKANKNKRKKEKEFPRMRRPVKISSPAGGDKSGRAESNERPNRPYKVSVYCVSKSKRRGESPESSAQLLCSKGIALRGRDPSTSLDWCHLSVKCQSI